MVSAPCHSGQDLWIFITSAFVSIFSIVHCYGEISVYDIHTDQQVAGPFKSLIAKFGPPLSDEGIFECGLVVFLQTAADGCNRSNMIPPPRAYNFKCHWILLMARGNCTFVQKVRNAQIFSYNMAIIYNNVNDVVPMDGTNSSDILIPAVSVSLSTGTIIQQKYQYLNEVYLVIEDDQNFPFDINADLLIPFAFVVVVCFITMISFMICKCFRDRRRARRRRLPVSSLHKIPTEKFSSKRSSFETCAICLDDYVDGEELRVLPCSHAYHSVCIDPWLTRNRRVCPICKRHVFASDELSYDGSESDSDVDNDERTPLVRSEVPQQRPTRRTYLLSAESLFTPISRFAWQYYESASENGSNNNSGPSSLSGSVEESDHTVVPAHIIHSINSVDDDSGSIGVLSSNYTRSSVAQLPQCNDSRDVQSHDNACLSIEYEIDHSETVARNHRIV